MALFADLLLGVATARHHSTESQTAGAEGATAVLTAELREGIHVNQTVFFFIFAVMKPCVTLTSFLKRLNFDAQQ